MAHHPSSLHSLQHAPQHPNIGTGGQYQVSRKRASRIIRRPCKLTWLVPTTLTLQLLDWLENVTFPRESMFKDVKYAKKVYEKVVKRTLNLGVSPSSPERAAA